MLSSESSQSCAFKQAVTVAFYFVFLWFKKNLFLACVGFLLAQPDCKAICSTWVEWFWLRTVDKL